MRCTQTTNVRSALLLLSFALACAPDPRAPDERDVGEVELPDPDPGSVVWRLDDTLGRGTNPAISFPADGDFFGLAVEVPDDDGATSASFSLRFFPGDVVPAAAYACARPEDADPRIVQVAVVEHGASGDVVYGGHSLLEGSDCSITLDEDLTAGGALRGSFSGAFPAGSGEDTIEVSGAFDLVAAVSGT